MERSSQPDDSDEDSISITSTAPSVHDSDESFPVVKILAERVHNRVKEYLVEWEGYTLDRASWEPHDNIEGVTLAEWRDRKRRQNAGSLEMFDVEAWEAHQLELTLEKADRRRRRKKKRKKLRNVSLGRPAKRAVKPKIIEIESTDEAMEENEVEDAESIPVKATRVKKSPSKRLLKKGTARPLPRAPRYEDSDEDPQPSAKQTPPVTSEQSIGVFSKESSIPPSSLPQQAKSSSPDEPLAQQRRPVVTTLSKTADSNIAKGTSDPKKKSASNGSLNQPAATSASFQAPQAPSMTAKEGSSVSTDERSKGPSSNTAIAKGKAPSVVSKNVFQAQGLPSFKRHGTLLENSIKAKKPKVYPNMRIQYKAEVQGRAVAEQEPDLEVVGGLFNPANPSLMLPITPGTLRRPSTGVPQPEEPIAPENEDVDMTELFDSDHDTPLPSGSPAKFYGPPVCFFWDQKQRKPDTAQPCQNGYMCKFLHEYRTGVPVAENPAFKESIPQDPSTSTVVSKPALASLQTTQPPPLICFYWDRYEQDGECRFSTCSRGSSCSYLHEYRFGATVAPEPASKFLPTLQPQSRENSLFVDGHITESPQSILPPWRVKDSEGVATTSNTPSLKNDSSDQSPASQLALQPQLVNQIQLASRSQSALRSVIAPIQNEYSERSPQSPLALQPQPANQTQIPSRPQSSLHPIIALAKNEHSDRSPQSQPVLQPQPESRPKWNSRDPFRAICYFWHRDGDCTRGRNCKFSHSNDSDLPIAPSPSKNDRYEPEPYYRHEPEPSYEPKPTPRPQASLRPEWDPSDPTRAICYFWSTVGTCSRGDSCKYAHSDRRDLPIAPLPGEQTRLRKSNDRQSPSKNDRYEPERSYDRYEPEPIYEPRPVYEPKPTSRPHSSLRPQWDPREPLRAICYFWSTTGSCTKGGNCKYFHSDSMDLPIAPTPEEQTRIRKSNNVICKFWERGNCPSSAEECSYVHPAPNTMKESEEVDTPSKALGSQRKSVKFAAEDPYASLNIDKHISDDRSKPLQNGRSISREVCKFWLRNDCHRGSNCHYSHELPAENINSHSNSSEKRRQPTPVQTSKEIRMADLPVARSSSSQNRLQPPSAPSGGDQAMTVPVIKARPDKISPSKIPKTSYQVSKNTQINLEEYRQKNMVTKSSASSKVALFGSEEAASVVLSFGSLPSNEHPWKVAFSSLTKIVFNQLCLSQDLEHQRRTIISTQLWQGNLNAVDEKDTETLNRITDELSSRSSGLLGVFETYSILVYPAGMADWKFLDGSLKCPADVRLRYLVFNPSIPQLVSMQNSSVPAGVGYRKFLVKKIHGLDFEHLLPLDPRIKGKSYAYKFYLMFPERAQKTADFLALWIRSCEPKCIVYHSSTEGSWDSFTRARNIGVVLLHDSVVADLYRVPSLGLSFLQERLSKTHVNTVFWRISERTAPYSVFPSATGYFDDSLTVGQLSATRLFPHGCVFLLTPSLLIAEPEYAFKLLDWFLFDTSKSKFENSAAPWKVVTCHDIISYTLSIASSKAREKAKWEAENRNNPALEAILEQRGLGYKTCETRFKLHSKLIEVLAKYNLQLSNNKQLALGVDFSPSLDDDLASPIVYAPSSIDADDEQQLVNWFAGWSMTRLDTFRKFIVVGTRENTSGKHLKRLVEVKKKKTPAAALNKEPPVTNSLVLTAREKALSIAAKYSPQTALKVDTTIAKAADAADDFLERLGQELSPSESSAMELDMDNSKPSASGIVTKPNGERFVPFSTREDNSTRKELRIKPGYEPQEDKEAYRHPNARKNSIGYSTGQSASSSVVPSPTTKTAQSVGAAGGDQMDLDVVDSPIALSDSNDSKPQATDKNKNTLQESEHEHTAWEMKTFEPTVVWYKQLQDKGEGWEHIVVGDVDTAALALGAPKP